MYCSFNVVSSLFHRMEFCFCAWKDSMKFLIFNIFYSMWYAEHVYESWIPANWWNWRQIGTMFSFLGLTQTKHSQAMRIQLYTHGPSFSFYMNIRNNSLLNQFAFLHRRHAYDFTTMKKILLTPVYGNIFNWASLCCCSPMSLCPSDLFWTTGSGLWKSSSKQKN